MKVMLPHCTYIVYRGPLWLHNELLHLGTDRLPLRGQKRGAVLDLVQALDEPPPRGLNLVSACSAEKGLDLAPVSSRVGV